MKWMAWRKLIIEVQISSEMACTTANHQKTRTFDPVKCDCFELLPVKVCLSQSGPLNV